MGNQFNAKSKNVVPTVSDIKSANIDQLADLAKKYVNNELKKKLTTSQIRNIFSRVKKLEKKAKNGNDTCVDELKELRIKFAYIGGRVTKNEVKKFMDLLDALAKDAKSPKDVVRFYEFIEAIVAYLKYFGDKY